MCFKCKKMYFACLGKTYIVEQPFFWLPGGLQLMGKGSFVKANGGGWWAALAIDIVCVQADIFATRSFCDIYIYIYICCCSDEGDTNGCRAYLWSGLFEDDPLAHIHYSRFYGMHQPIAVCLHSHAITCQSWPIARCYIVLVMHAYGFARGSDLKVHAMPIECGCECA